MSTTTPVFHSTTVIFTYPGSTIPGLKAIAKCYVPFNQPKPGNFGLTLILTYCISAHKEIWEPILENLLKLHTPKDLLPGQQVPLIHKVWSIEWQHHGESAILNHPVLTKVCNGTCCEWVLAVKHLVQSKMAEGHRLVGISHSAGACAM
ncbi:hypothetical protein OBBRIDRAFT_735183 [Obba rivulosa]|uniref:Uncharacterized protein n=1 Tax=Obba rivulosa TaxID=1052685 RepID=A0A8E2AYZ2_9APHY|nr:hypothetical protein OBBRIDRAFT_735183 [Obba rivulosa]